MQVRVCIYNQKHLYEQVILVTAINNRVFKHNITRVCIRTEKIVKIQDGLVY